MYPSWSPHTPEPEEYYPYIPIIFVPQGYANAFVD